MKKRIMFSLIALIGTVCMAVTANAGEVTWNILTHSSKVNVHPGNDGLMGTIDDVIGGDTRNSAGSFAVDLMEWGTPSPTFCPAKVGPDEVSYGTGTLKWCMGDPSSTQVKWTSWNQNQTSIPQYGAPYAYRLTAGGAPNSGSPCGTGTVTNTVDFELTIGGIPILSFADETITKHVYAVSDPSPGPITCAKVDGGTATYSTSDLNVIKGLLPGGATAFMVECFAAQQGADPNSCFNNMWLGTAVIHWTSDNVTACDGDCGGDPGPCAGGPAE